MANNFKPWVDDPTADQQVQSALTFSTDEQRIEGFKAGDPASAIRVNSALRQANVVIAGLMQMCDEIVTLPDCLSLMSSITDIKNAIKSAIDKLDTNVLNSAKSYTDSAKTTLEGSISNVQSQVTSNKNTIDSHTSQISNLNEEVAALEGGSSTLTTRVGTLESEMDTAQSDINKLKSAYELTISTSQWLGDGPVYSYSVSNDQHQRGAYPHVQTYYNNNAIECLVSSTSSGMLTFNSNKKIDLYVKIS